MSNSSIGIIGGADGPTSVFVAGRKKAIPIKIRFKNWFYKWKGRQAAKKITAGERTLAEMVAYAAEKYNAVEADITQRKYASQKNCLKESLINRYDFHVYEISIGDGRLELEIDYHWEFLGISYSGSKKSMKQMKKLAKDLYLYYGVSEEDIRQKSERYHALLATLSI